MAVVAAEVEEEQRVVYMLTALLLHYSSMNVLYILISIVLMILS